MASEKLCRYSWRALGVALYATLLALGTTAHPAIAAPFSISVTVILTAPPCVINNNNLIEVNFGNDVLTTLVGGGDYKKTLVRYLVECPTEGPSAMGIRIVGTGAAFNHDVLTTNITDFGIALSSNGTSLPINSTKDFTYPALPEIYAVPVKRPGATLSGGVFSAGAIMMVEYR